MTLHVSRVYPVIQTALTRSCIEIVPGTTLTRILCARSSSSCQISCSRRRCLWFRKECLANSKQPSSFSSAIARFSSTSTRSSTSSGSTKATNQQHPNHPNVGAAVGLFSIPTLDQPNDFMRLASRATSECDDLRHALSQTPPPTTVAQASQLLRMLDDVSKTVCNVIDAAELCRSVHSSRTWRNSAQQTFAFMSEYIALLNSDLTLYVALTSVISNSHLFHQLQPEEQRFAVLLKEEFERDGIHLPEEERNQVRELQNSVTQLETLFSENITHSKKHFQVPAAPVDDLIPRDVLEQHIPQHQQQYTNNGGDSDGATPMVTLNTDPGIANTLLKYSASPELRKEVYMETNTACPENLDVLEALRQRRHQVATQLGYSSYAERFLKDKMAGNPTNVLAFLNNLQQRIDEGGHYKRDMKTLASAKQQFEGSSVLEPWDLPFYTGVLKARNGFDSGSISPYLTLGGCLNAMTTLVNKLFGIQIVEEQMQSTERWDLDHSNDHTGANEDVPNVRKFVFLDPKDRPLGTMYLDLHPREGKYNHAAHFTVRCGCAIGPTVAAAASDNNGNDSATPNDNYQLPVVALVCNMTSPSVSPVLSHSEVETLFHEFGHALHSLLSRTSFQHMSGTRGAMDFVETPSHLFEQYVWDPNFLTLLARHHETGEQIPNELIQQLVQSRNDFRCMDVQNQILYARFDQAIFGIPSSPTGTTTTPSNNSTTTQLFAQLHKQHHVPYAEGTHWHSRFGHLVTYGAGYYGYLYAQVFADDIWKERFRGDSLRRESGDRLWGDMLVHGGAKNPNAMLRTVLGREPKVDSFLEMMQS